MRSDPEIPTAVAGGIAGAIYRLCLHVVSTGVPSNKMTYVHVGAITATVVCPLDVLKTRLQVQSRAAINQGIRGTCRDVFLMESEFQ